MIIEEDNETGNSEYIALGNQEIEKTLYANNM